MPKETTVTRRLIPCKATPWIVEAIRLGHASEKDKRIHLCPEYLETIAFSITADVLTIDFNSEAEWIADATALKVTQGIIFSIGSKLGFFLPLDPSTLNTANYLVIARNEKPISPPEKLEKWPLAQEFFTEPCAVFFEFSLPIQYT